MSRDDDFSKSGNTHSGQRVGQVKEVTSLTNPIVKDLRSLALKKFRDQQGVFLAEGLKLVFAKSGKGNKMVEQVAARTFAKGALVLEVTEKIMAAITRRDNPQMVVGVFEQQYQQLSSLKPKGNDVYIALDRVRDPGNLGTVIRTADAVGAKGIILIGDTTDPYSLETVRATMGSIFSMPLYKTTESDFLNWRKGFSGLLVGTHLKGAVDYRTIPYAKKPVILMMGNEQQGLPDNLAESCDKLARIPQAGRADSLNLAIATGVMLYEIRREALTLDERASG